VPYYSLWTDPQSINGLATSALGGFEAKSFGGQAAPMWMRQFPGEVGVVFFTVFRANTGMRYCGSSREQGKF
jgi:hypothetical protein